MRYLLCLLLASSLSLSTCQPSFDPYERNEPRERRGKNPDAQFAGVTTVPHIEQYDAIPEGPYGEDMSWTTGGACDDIVDCALTGQNFCATHGGVAVMQYNSRDTTDWACQMRCVDETIGHTECLDATLPPLPRPGATTPEPKEEPEPDCDPNLEGPPNPACPAPGDCNGTCA